MRFISTITDRFYAAIDSRIDRAVARVLSRDKSMLAEQVAESYRHMIEAGCNPASVADQLDPRKVAEQVAVDEVARYVDMGELADHVADKVDIDHSDIATRLARNLDMDDVVSHVASEIDMGQVCEQCAERIEVDEDEVIRRAAEMAADNIDADAVAERTAEHVGIDAQDVADKVAENIDIDTDEITEKAVEQIVGEIDLDSVAEQVAEHIAANEEIDYERLAKALLAAFVAGMKS